MSYADHVEQQEAEMLKHLQICRTCACPHNKHAHQRTAFACHHCTQQDEVHPVGIVRMPKGYFLCKKCKELLERHRLEFVNELATTCSACIWEEIHRIITINPELFEDLAIPGTFEDPAPIKA
jgi:hypothetical protein